MPRVIVDDYPHQRGGHCGSGALRDLLEWSGLGWGRPLTESLVFGLGGGLAFHYLRTPGPRSVVYFVGRNGAMEGDFCARLGIGMERSETDDPEAGQARLFAELDCGRPVMVWADIAKLPYLRVRMEMTRHDIVVIGYDTGAGLAYVVDNDRDDVQEVPLEALAAARTSTGFPAPNRNTMFPMRFPDGLPDLLPAARAAAAGAVAELGRTEGSSFETPGLAPGSVLGVGLAGVEAFAADVAAWPDDLDEEGLGAALRSLPVFVEKAGTGGGLFRRLQAGFCTDVAEQTGAAEFAAAGDAYRACAEGWSALAALGAQDNPDMGAVVAAAAALPGLENTAAAALAAT